MMNAYEQGLVTEETITEAAVRLFTTRFLLGLFDETDYDKIKYDVVECKEHLALASRATKESVVLLKNDGKIKMGQVFSLTLRNFVRHNGTKNAAALAYYLLFALFPLLIFISNLLGNLDLDIYQITNTLGEILPEDVVNIIESYLGYVADNSTHTLMWFSLVFSVIFPMRAVKGLMVDVRRAYGLGSPTYPTLFLIVQFLYTLIFRENIINIL